METTTNEGATEMTAALTEALAAQYLTEADLDTDELNQLHAIYEDLIGDNTPTDAAHMAVEEVLEGLN